MESPINKPGPFKKWVLATRPKTLVVGICPVVLGLGLAYKEGSFNALVAVITLCAAVLIQIGTNFSNDYIDFKKGADTEDRLGPQRMVQSGAITIKAMKFATIITFILAFILGLYLAKVGGTPILIIGILAIISGYAYTGGPFPFAYTGLADCVVLLFFGPIAVGGTYYLQTGLLHTDVLIAGLAPGLFGMAILAVNNLRDIQTDKLAGKRTLAVRIGKEFAIFEYATCLFAACAIPIYLIVKTQAHFSSAFAILTFLFAIPYIQLVARESGEALNTALAKTASLLVIYTVLFVIGW
ncbi:MAG: 1,4-dihydroxy-2-naphthoate polyprenyltransferase [bacterium]|nr:1,4-dihydroxy-2-naphthoate polyprenyltransferase [bacterium]